MAATSVGGGPASNKKVTNQQILDALSMFYGDDVLGTDRSQLVTGGQSTEFKNKLKGLGITDEDFTRAQDIARIGEVKNARQAVDLLQATGMSPEQITTIMGNAGATITIPKGYTAKYSDLMSGMPAQSVSVGTLLGELGKVSPSVAKYMAPKAGLADPNPPPPAPPPAEKPAEPPGAPAAPRGTVGGDLGAPVTGPAKTPPQDPMQAWMDGKGPAPKGASDADVQAYIRKNYPGEISGLMQIPEIWNIVRQSATEGRPTGWVTGQVEGTKYWQTHDTNMRQWDSQAAKDPETQRNNIQKESQDIAQWASKYGVTLTPERLKDLATQSLIHGWKPEDKHRVLSNEFHYSPGASADPQVVSELKKKAGDYYIPLSDEAITQWGQHVMAADGDMSGFDGYLIQQAKSLYPTLANALDRGVSVKTFADPYAQIASQMLEVPKDQIDFKDPKFMQALVHTDPKTNDRTFMNLYDWQSELKSNSVYGWDKTQNARDEATSLSQKIIQRFGGGV